MVPARQLAADPSVDLTTAQDMRVDRATRVVQGDRAEATAQVAVMTAAGDDQVTARAARAQEAAGLPEDSPQRDQ